MMGVMGKEGQPLPAEKTALVIHGWPSPVDKGQKVYQVLENEGYNVIAPYLFDECQKISREDISTTIETKLEGRQPEVIVGISMGGIVAQWMAEKYPQSKLILVASGARIQPKGLLVKLWDWTGLRWVSWAVSGVFRLPENWLVKGYNKASPWVGQMYKTDEENLRTNLGYARKIHPRKQWESILMLKETDNRKLLGQLKNTTLVLNGADDFLMPPELGQEICEKMDNGYQTVVPGSHFDLLNDRAMKEIEMFLK
jgi:pimeloyl-ACP methyl ester carboxylesterase